MTHLIPHRVYSRCELSQLSTPNTKDVAELDFGASESDLHGCVVHREEGLGRGESRGAPCSPCCRNVDRKGECTPKGILCHRDSQAP